MSDEPRTPAEDIKAHLHRKPDMIRVRYWEQGVCFADFTDYAWMARAYAEYAQLCRYGLKMEVV